MAEERGAGKTEDGRPEEAEYIGNIWGWRFSLIGLILLLLMLALMVYRHYALDVPFGGEEPERTERPVDTQ